MKKTLATLPILAALCGIFWTAPASAAVLTFDNLSAPTTDADPIAAYGPIAASFSTSSYATTLDQVSFRLSGTPDSGSVTARLRANSSTSPGSVLGTIGTVNDSSLSSILASYTLTPATQFTLAANTRYWIELTSNNSSANWAWSGNISGPGVAGEYFSNSSGVFANATESPYQLQVLTAMPEPSSLAMLGLGLVGAAVRRKLSA